MTRCASACRQRRLIDALIAPGPAACQRRRRLLRARGATTTESVNAAARGPSATADVDRRDAPAALARFDDAPRTAWRPSRRWSALREHRQRLRAARARAHLGADIGTQRPGIDSVSVNGACALPGRTRVLQPGQKYLRRRRPDQLTEGDRAAPQAPPNKIDAGTGADQRQNLAAEQPDALELQKAAWSLTQERDIRDPSCAEQV